VVVFFLGRRVAHAESIRDLPAEWAQAKLDVLRLGCIVMELKLHVKLTVGFSLDRDQ
jgi:hypothetical protein